MTKYHRIYQQLMERARGRVLSEYFEKHHIIPSSLDGDDSPENIVNLTYREHFLAHWLLTKMHKGKAKIKTQYALALMGRGRSGQKFRTSWQYAIARKNFVMAARGRKLTKEHKEKLRLANTGKKLTDETKEKLRGKKCTKETKEKIRLANMGNKHSLGRVLTPEHLAALRAGLKSYWDTCRAI